LLIAVQGADLAVALVAVRAVALDADLAVTLVVVRAVDLDAVQVAELNAVQAVDLDVVQVVDYYVVQAVDLDAALAVDLDAALAVDSIVEILVLKAPILEPMIQPFNITRCIFRKIQELRVMQNTFPMEMMSLV